MAELKKVGIQGLGYYLPEHVIDNSYFIDVLGLDTTDEWIQQRSGITERRWARDDEYTSDLSTSAALNAMKNADITAEEIDFMLIGNCTPDYQFPTTSNIVHKNLGLRPDCGVIDTPSACSSFMYALTLGTPLIKCGEAKKVLVIGAEKLSAILNIKDRGTCVLLGDAAGAMVLTEHTEELPEILAHTYGNQLNIDALYRPMSGLREMPTHEGIDNDRQFMIMKGREIYAFAVRKFYEETLNVVKKAGLTMADVSYIVPHQVNSRIIASAAEKLNFPIERIYMTLNKTGNTSGASIPTALGEANEKGLFKKGDIVVLVAFGGGLTWGGGIIRW